MYLPKNKYSKPRHSPGGEFSLDNKEYVGWYIQTYTKEYYSGKTLNKNSKLLFKLSDSDNIIDRNENDPFIFSSVIVSPTPRERSNGIWKRYFLKDPRNNKIIEVDKKKYLLFKRKTYVLRAELDWKIEGPAENQNINGYTYFGATHVNKVNTQALESTIKGITTYIKDYSEFVE